MNGKKGMELAFGTIIVIVLSVIILASLIFIFTKGTSSFKNLLEGFSSDNNIDSIVSSCNIIAQNSQAYDFCCSQKEVKMNAKSKIMMTCLNASEQSWGKNIINLNCAGVC